MKIPLESPISNVKNQGDVTEQVFFNPFDLNRGETPQLFSIKLKKDQGHLDEDFESSDLSSCIDETPNSKKKNSDPKYKKNRFNDQGNDEEAARSNNRDVTLPFSQNHTIPTFQPISSKRDIKAALEGNNSALLNDMSMSQLIHEKTKKKGNLYRTVNHGYGSNNGSQNFRSSNREIKTTVNSGQITRKILPGKMG